MSQATTRPTTQCATQASATAPARRDPAGLRTLLRHPAVGAVAVFAGLFALPYSTLDVPGVFAGPLDSPGVLQLLAVCLLYRGLAISYDLLFGHTGIMSFGHGLFVTGGMFLGS